MVYKKIGPVEIMGDNGGRVPLSTSLIITGNEDSTLIDCGSGQKTFDYIQKNHKVNTIYLTHHHIDHVWGAQLFPNAEKLINKYDIEKIADYHELAKSEGLYAVYGKADIDKWIQDLKEKTYWDTVVEPKVLNVSKTHEYNQVIDLSGVDVMFIHAPGHTEGFCTPYILDYGILHVGDIDLTSFGPYYGDAESNIDQFIKSAKKTLDVDAKYFVTSHHKGIFLRDDYERELEKYLSIIERKEEKIKKLVKSGCLPKDLIHQEIFYYKSQSEHNLVRRKTEIVSIVKHLKRLIDHGERFTDYLEDFIRINNINEEYIEYSSFSDKHRC
ncbi:MBL fold metallo-hydrolase [Sporosarcina sp. P13]|uniref:MBL fold metallo-hydrolase n=1 Tax=Sporosarcina sp. P13 TaxID=2048263 RepID=UPI000C173A01|nr:MBL fold metallo-hydrolase [Sporosarcina sp. P13]PIC64922.1 MBL fold metallo-hydrolase [Sporosarcina sp. P13]